jgi:ribonuclease HII
MERAIRRLPTQPDHLLIDAVRLPSVDIPQTAIIDGDARCLSIAAASIVAKVYRDRLMTLAAARYPTYGFAAHKGYGTRRHRQALIEFGACPIHRYSFSPCSSSPFEPRTDDARLP